MWARLLPGRSCSECILFLAQAVNAGNLSASLAAARLCELSAEPEDAAQHWARAARLGHPEAQWRLGFAFYRGIQGPRDSEEALMWLSRAAKQLVGVVADQPVDLPETPAQHIPPAVPLFMTTASCRRTLANAAHILGCLYLDGEGTKQDAAAAVKWLGTAQHCGCVEAAGLLASLFRSGQY